MLQTLMRAASSDDRLWLYFVNFSKTLNIFTNIKIFAVYDCKSTIYDKCDFAGKSQSKLN